MATACMDNFPWLEAAFLQFKTQNSFPYSRTYSSMCEESSSLIDFVPSKGLSLRVDRQFSPVLLRSVSLSLPNRGFSLNFAHKSPNGPDGSAFPFFGPYFMFGKLSTEDSGRIEAFYTQRVSKGGLVYWSSLLSNICSHYKVADSVQPHVHGKIQWDWPYATVSTSYSSFGRIVGLHLLTRSAGSSFTWMLGGEVYYTVQEHSGGFSLGSRIESRSAKHAPFSPIIFTMTSNPLMGHYRTTLTSPFILNSLVASTRFDLNVNSYESDLAVGLNYQPRDDDAIKVSLSLQRGISFILQSRISDQFKIRFSLKTDRLMLGSGEPTQTESYYNLLLGNSATHASFGLDLAFTE